MEQIDNTTLNPYAIQSQIELSDTKKNDEDRERDRVIRESLWN